VALAGAGVNVGSSGDGFELFDEQKLGASEFQQQVTYQRALEGEIARTIGGVEGVSNPSVQLVLPEDDLFADEATPATAAVMLGNSADSMDPGAVRGIAQLVSSSVKGLKTDNVTITDAAGTLLWPQGDGAGGAGMVAGKQALEARFSRAMEADLNALLVQTLGPGKGQVSVTADLNADKTTRDNVTYDRRSAVPLKTQTETERLRGGGATAGGTAGTGGNIPQYSQNAQGGGANSNYQRETENTEFGVNKQVDRTEIAPGAINKLHVALLVDKSVPAADFTSLEQAVTSAAGIDTARGDVIQAAQVPFAKPEAPKAGPVPTTMLGPIKWVGIGLASLLFLFFMSRALRKREGEALQTPAWLTSIEEPVSLAELEQQTQVLHPPAPTITLPPRAPDANLQALDQLMEREPERVAAQVKNWMAQD
ncbi:MAG TPA: flagellar basal-body MS-ring/collar protein FliF, partial [Solirubrobacteraceae bacterium]|nr:flagellar basal-body MS-ring/collar protein FliF [Solirubrobacteraceae bacterium]